MMRELRGPILTTVFVDYDNVYLSLKRKSEEAAKRFSKDASRWIKEIESGRLMTPTNGPAETGPRRIVINRCYGNPVPRRNQSDNSTDMSSFPFVRHHFLRAGFEVIDCPPLTAQLKNSADIRMVMDVRDILTHDTYYNEFVILSGDADFTPVLHRLRSHARRTVIYSNDNTAAPYTAICDAEIRESDFLALLLEGQLPGRTEPAQVEQHPEHAALPSSASLETARKEILAEVMSVVRATNHPVPLEALADRAVRNLGYDKTVGSAWGGVGGFRDLLVKGLPEDIRLTEQPPYYVYDAKRAAQRDARRAEPRMESRTPEPLRQEAAAAPMQRSLPPLLGAGQPAQRPVAAPPGPPAQVQRGPLAPAQSEALSGQPGQSRPPTPSLAQDPTAVQQATIRIIEASQAPALSPNDYAMLFEVMAQEIGQNRLMGTQTLLNIVKRAQEMGVDVRRDDARFILDVVSEADPWFDQGISASLFASRFRNFVVARCRGQGLNLSADELDLIEAWFARPSAAAAQRAAAGPQTPAYGSAQAPAYAPPQGRPQAAPPPAQAQQPPVDTELRADRWWSLDERPGAAGDQGNPPNDEFPRIIRTRLRG